MKWAYIFLTIFVIIISMILMIRNSEIFFAYDKSPWINNIRVLGLLAGISLILFSFACEIGRDENKLIEPFLFLVLFFFLLWNYSLTLITNFSLMCISAWIVFILTLVLMIVLSHTKRRSLSIVTFPFLATSLLMLSISHDIKCNNPEKG